MKTQDFYSLRNKSLSLPEGNLLALVPCYENGGNAVRIMTTEAEVVDTRSLRWLLSLVASGVGLDLQALRVLSSKVLLKKNSLPIPIGSGLVLVPLKMRQIEVDGDPASGFINAFQVEDVKEKSSGGAVVVFKNGAEVSTIFKKKTVQKRLKDAEAVYHRFQAIRGQADVYRVAESSENQFDFGQGKHPKKGRCLLVQLLASLNSCKDIN